MTQQPPDSVALFAADLRELRRDAGDPILEALAVRSKHGRTTLSKAFRGKELPTRNTLIAIVSALGGDEDEWLQRWTRLRLADVESVADDHPKTRRSRTVRMVIEWHTALVGAVCLAAGAGIGVAAAGSPGGSSSPTPQHVAVTPGDDPWAEPACQADAARQTFATRADHYLVEIFWSPTCDAMWGQVTRFDGGIQGNSLSAAISVGFQPDTTQTVTANDVQAVHTPLLLSPGRLGTVCVTGVAQVGATDLALSPPLCTDGR